MMTSLLLVDVEGFETLAGGRADPGRLLSTLGQDISGAPRQIAVMRAYCSGQIEAGRRTAYREAGFDIIETAGSDETLILMTLDLASLSHSDTVYEEAMLLGGASDYTALARLAREQLMQVALASHDAMPASLAALTDTKINSADLPISPAEPKPEPELRPSDKEAPKQKGDPWPDDKSGTILVAGAAAAGIGAAAGLAMKKEEPAKVEAPKAEAPKAEAPKAEAPKIDASKAAPVSKAPVLPKIAKEDKAPSPVETAAPVMAKPLAEAKVTETKTVDAKTSDAEPEVDAQLEDAIAASLSDDLDIDLADESSTPAPIMPPLVASKAPEPAKADSTASGEQGDDSNIDALFADLTSDDLMSKPLQDSATIAAAADPAKLSKKATADADADVDALLTQLMSDDLSLEPATGGKEVALDVVPER